MFPRLCLDACLPCWLALLGALPAKFMGGLSWNSAVELRLDPPGATSKSYPDWMELARERAWGVPAPPPIETASSWSVIVKGREDKVCDVMGTDVCVCVVIQK